MSLGLSKDGVVVVDLVVVVVMTLALIERGFVANMKASFLCVYEAEAEKAVPVVVVVAVILSLGFVSE